jgi:hypothetical protein
MKAQGGLGADKLGGVVVRALMGGGDAMALFAPGERVPSPSRGASVAEARADVGCASGLLQAEAMRANEAMKARRAMAGRESKSGATFVLSTQKRGELVAAAVKKAARRSSGALAERAGPSATTSRGPLPHGAREPIAGFLAQC